MPDFHLTPTTFTVADYCAAFGRREIQVNRDYQRSDKVWPLAAQSFLIETILLGYPIPKLSLHQITDIRTRQSMKEIIDGQQRTRAIKSFFDNGLRLSRTSDLDDAAGRTYADLPQELQQAFLEYPLAIDLFTGALPDQIREVFRRINSYTVPLNPEEQRHATYQGEMKWFIYSLCKEFDHKIASIGTFTQRSLIRMADAKLYAEIVHALMEGVQTTKRIQLDRLYRSFDRRFNEKEEYWRRFCRSIEQIMTIVDVHRGPLMKPHIMYSFLLATMHYLSPVGHLQELIPNEDLRNSVDVETAAPALSELAAGLDADEPPRDLEQFVSASQAKTNVKRQREIRITWLYNALNGEVGTDL